MNGHDLYLLTGACVALFGLAFFIWTRRPQPKPKKVGKYRMFFDMKHPEEKRIDLGVFEGTLSDAVEAAYMEQIQYAFTYMSNHREPNMAVMGNYGVEEVRDEPAAP